MTSKGENSISVLRSIVCTLQTLRSPSDRQWVIVAIGAHHLAMALFSEKRVSENRRRELLELIGSGCDEDTWIFDCIQECAGSFSSETSSILQPDSI